MLLLWRSVRHARFAKGRHHTVGARRKNVRSTCNNLPQVVVIERNQRQQLLMFFGRKIRPTTLKQTRENQIVLQKTTTAAPAQFGEFKVGDHTAFFLKITRPA
jgi:hypothetical protein